MSTTSNTGGLRTVGEMAQPETSGTQDSSHISHFSNVPSITNETANDTTTLSSDPSQAPPNGNQPEAGTSETTGSAEPSFNLPYRPTPMCRKRRADSGSAERSVRQRANGGNTTSEFATPFFVAANASEQNSVLADPSQDVEQGEIKDANKQVRRGVRQAKKTTSGLAASKWATGSEDVDMGASQANPAKETTASVLHDPLTAKVLVTAGRTIHYKRLLLSLDGQGSDSLHFQLAKCLANPSPISEKKQRAVHQALEDSLYYIVCWNRDAFPKIVGKKAEYKELFPPLFPGSPTSLFTALQADGLDVDRLDFTKTQETASLIYKTVLKRVQIKASESHLLQAEPVSIDTPPSWLQKKPGESRKAFRKRKERAMNDLPTAPQNLLTLAFTAENFQTGLVRVMGDSGVMKGKQDDRMRDAVEALLYRLATKEPRAFPEIFSVA
ncbi:hypothetical protein LTR37_009018 [Vermiconidia calcicola]|uniref:Uncharacterized protein n=1 Tax=Vermiconidia calcicola TaxID=1690605 RepID=A0ACC3N975_9PEZI|nr:hypothetical protein LTR37_009018 [Vermiconidia calcicola]